MRQSRLRAPPRRPWTIWSLRPWSREPRWRWRSLAASRREIDTRTPCGAPGALTLPDPSGADAPRQERCRPELAPPGRLTRTRWPTAGGRRRRLDPSPLSTQAPLSTQRGLEVACPSRAVPVPALCNGRPRWNLRVAGDPGGAVAPQCAHIVLTGLRRGPRVGARYGLTRDDTHGPVVQFGVHAGLSSRRSRVQIPSGPPLGYRPSDTVARKRSGPLGSPRPRASTGGPVRGRVAQLVERAPEKREVTGSTPVPTTRDVQVRRVAACAARRLAGFRSPKRAPPDRVSPPSDTALSRSKI